MVEFEKIKNADAFVEKRDGERQPFDVVKIEKALEGAFNDSKELKEPRHLTVIAHEVAAKAVTIALESEDSTINIESVQDLVQMQLMRRGFVSTAHRYMEHRVIHAQARLEGVIPDARACSQYINAAKYARHIEDFKRRETYTEVVRRRMNMDMDYYASTIERHPILRARIEEAGIYMEDNKVLPSMRSLQFGGEAILQNHNRIYNCSFTHIDRIEAFSHAFHLLLSGSGVGYSVQWHHVEKLPALKVVDATKVRHHIIADTIEGWSDAVYELINSFVKGYHIEFSYHRIRKRGTPLRTSGGRAPGHLGLKDSLERIRNILAAAQGRQLKPIEAHDIMCWIAEAVLSGGIRRSSMICLFSPDDGEMLQSKTGNWFETNLQRRMANNSVVLVRKETRKHQFRRIFKNCREFGEPGIFFTDNPDHGTNPCGEIGLDPVLVLDEETLAMAREWEAIDPKNHKLPKNIDSMLGKTFTGFSFCNLSTINAASCETPEEFYKRCEVASFIGTLQAGYNNLKYLDWVSSVIARRDSLIGVSITAMAESPDIAFNPEVLRKGAEIVNKTNEEVAAMIGIRKAARSTTIKPEGTATLKLGLFSHGCHPAWSEFFFRRVTAHATEPVFQWFMAHNPHMCEQKPDGDYCIVFPVRMPEGTVTRYDLNGISFLDNVAMIYENWVKPGTVRSEDSPGLTHNVSNTCIVPSGEWDSVEDYLWKHPDQFKAVSFLPDDGDKKYAFAPMEAVTSDADKARFRELVEKYTPVDYLAEYEAEDMTDRQGEAACAGGACMIV